MESAHEAVLFASHRPSVKSSSKGTHVPASAGQQSGTVTFPGVLPSATRPPNPLSNTRPLSFHPLSGSLLVRSPSFHPLSRVAAGTHHKLVPFVYLPSQLHMHAHVSRQQRARRFLREGLCSRVKCTGMHVTDASRHVSTHKQCVAQAFHAFVILPTQCLYLLATVSTRADPPAGSRLNLKASNRA